MELQIAWQRDPARSLKAALAFATSARHSRLCFQALRLVIDHDMEKENEPAMMKALAGFLEAHPKSSGAWEAVVIRQAYRLMSGQVTEADLAEVKRLHAKPLPGQETRIRTLLGQYLLDLKHPAEVVELLEPALKTEPTLINHFQLGTALAALQEPEEALQVLQEGLHADSGELPEDQVNLIKKKIEELIRELGKPS